MAPETLFDIVQNLTPEQKSVFRRWLNSRTRHKSKAPKYLVLYRRMEALEVFDDQQIRRKGFEDPSEYYKRRNQLLESLISCFTEGKSGDFSRISTALDLGAWELAQKFFKKEVERAYKEEDYPDLQKLGILRDETWEDWRMEIDSLVDLPETIQISHLVLQKVEGFRLLRKARESFKKGLGPKLKMAEQIDTMMNGINQFAFREFELESKLRIHSAILKGHHKDAAKIQVKSAKNVLSGERAVPVTRLIRTVSNAVTSSLLLQDRKEAMFFSFQLGKIEVQNHLQEKMKLEFWMKRTIDTGFAFGEEELVEKGLRELNATQQYLSNYTTAFYLYKGALAFLTCGNIDRSHDVIRELDNSPRSIRDHLPWEIDILNLILHLEKGNFDLVFDSLKWKKRKFRAKPYISLMLDAIGYLVTPMNRPNLQQLQPFIDQQKVLIETGDVPIRNQTFDLGLYLQAKAEGKTMREVFTERTKSEVMTMAVGL